MYDRDYAGKTLNFEASGGLIESSLIMQDRQTDTYWSIMTGDAVGGELEGTKLVELPLGKKVQWKDWVAEHPDTLVLSVGGRQDIPGNVYDSYFKGSSGFGGAAAKDKRLKTKDSIYAFQHGGKKYAVDARSIEGGKVFELTDGSKVFLYRSKKAPLFESSAAYISAAGFERRDGGWVEVGSGARFSAKKSAFDGGSVERLGGFDTFWYNWSLMNPETELLK